MTNRDRRNRRLFVAVKQYSLLRLRSSRTANRVLLKFETVSNVIQLLHELNSPGSPAKPWAPRGGYLETPMNFSEFRSIFTENLFRDQIVVGWVTTSEYWLSCVFVTLFGLIGCWGFDSCVGGVSFSFFFFFGGGLCSSVDSITASLITAIHQIIMNVDTNGEDFDHSIIERDLPEFQCGRVRKISLERRYRIEL